MNRVERHVENNVLVQIRAPRPVSGEGPLVSEPGGEQASHLPTLCQAG